MDRWLGVKFPEPKNLSAAEVRQYPHDNYRSFAAELQFSDDGSDWHTYQIADLTGGEELDGSPKWERVPAFAKVESLDFF